MGLQLRLHFGLYVRPRRALAAIMDEGSIIFGAIAVLLVAGLFEAGAWARYWGDVARLGSGSLEHARWALEKFTGQRTHDPEGLCLLGDALLVLERRDEARARFQAAIEAADTTPGYRRHEIRGWRKHAARRLGAV